MKRILRIISELMRMVFKLNIFRTYLVVITALVLQSIFMYSFYNRTLIKHTEIVNNIILENSIDTIEAGLLELEKITYVLSVSNRLYNINTYGDELNETQMYEVMQTVYDLRNYESFNRLVDEIFVVFNNGMTISSKGRYNTSFLVNEVKPGLASLIDGIQNYNYRKITVTEGNNNQNNIIYMQSIPFGSINNIRATVLIQINRNQLMSVLDHNKITKNTTTRIVFPNDITLSNRYDAVISAFGYVNPETGSDYVFRVPFNKFDLELIYSVPEHEFLMHRIPLKDVISFAILFSFVIITILALFLAYNDYKHLKDMFAKITDLFSRRKSRNMFACINESFRNIEEENIILKETMSKNSQIIKEYVLEKFLSDEKNPMIDTKQEYFDINISSKQFILYTVKTNEGNMYDASYVNETINKNLPALKDSLTCLYNGVVVLITGLDDITCEETWNIGMKLTDIFGNKSQSYTSTGFSSAKKSLNELKQAFDEAYEASRFGILYQEKCVSFDRISADETGAFYYPIEIEQRIIQSTRAGNYKNIESILNETKARNFYETRLPYEKVRLLYMEMANTVIKASEEAELNTEQNIFKLFSGDIPIDLAFIKLKDIYSEICSNVSSRKKSSNQLLYERVVDFIKENYSNSDLCLDSVAEALNITPKYLSHFFKEQSGVYFKDYVNKLRINKAQEMFEGSDDLKIYEVADKVGYRNSAGLIRAFNKYLGITPGEFKESSV